MNFSNGSVDSQHAKQRPDLIPCWLFVLSCCCFDGFSCKCISNAAIRTEIRNLRPNYSVEIRAICSVFCVLLNRSKSTSRSPQMCSDKVSRSHFCCKKHHWHEPLADPSSVAWRSSGDTRLPTTTVIGQDILCLSKPFNIIWTSLPFQVTVASSPSQAVPFKASSLALPPTGQSS